MDLLARMQRMLEQEELRISRRLAESEALLKELTEVKLTARSSGRVRLGADGYEEHDDLVIAVGLACWAGRREMSVELPPNGRLFW